MPEDNPTEEVEESEVVERDVAHKRITLPEVREVVGEIKTDIVRFIGEEAVELISQPVKETIREYAQRGRRGVRNLLIGVSTPSTPEECGWPQRDGTICRRAVPCRYHKEGK